MSDHPHEDRVPHPSPETGGDRRDRDADQREADGARRDLVEDERDQAGDARDDDGAHRDRLAELRHREGVRREERAQVRDVLADERDDLGAHRDRDAEERDRAAERWHAAPEPAGADRAEQVLAARVAAAADREQAMQDRRAAADDRALTRTDRARDVGDRSASADERATGLGDRVSARADRTAGAAQRVGAVGDRVAAHDDRVFSAADRRSAEVDELTGVRSRSAGLAELRRDVARSHREGRSLVLAFVDADHLKQTNDTQGHSAGDRVLVRLAQTLSHGQRSYDVVMRFGGDEFVCVMPEVSMAAAGTRMRRAGDAFAAGGGAFTFGLAELEPGDTENTLIARADAALYAERARHRAG